MIDLIAGLFAGGFSLLMFLFIFGIIGASIFGTLWAIVSSFKKNNLVTGSVLVFLILATFPIGWAVYYLLSKRGIV